MTKNLGKGLAALFGEEENAVVRSINPVQEHASLPTVSITPNPNQPRYIFQSESIDDLVRSIEAKGILQPILVRSTGSNQYQIIAGERRWRAASKIGLSMVPVRIIECNEQECLELALIENLQRENLNPLEEAQSLQALYKEYNRDYEQIAQSLGKSRSYVVNMIRLNHLPQSIKDDLKSGMLSASHARTLLTAQNPEQLWNEAKERNLSVRDLEYVVNASKKTKLPAPKEKKILNEAPAYLSDIQEIAQRLEKNLSTPVKIIIKGEKIHIQISFGEIEKFDDFVQLLA
jgi:ParB family chromosome partitioning protein